MRSCLIALLLAATAHAAVPEAKKPDDVMRAFRKDARIRVLNVWATWCVPCVAEIGDLQRIADRFAKSGVEVVGVSLDDAIPGDRAVTRARVDKFLASRHITFHNVYYTGRTPELLDLLRFDGAIPVTIVYDASGKELARNEGQLDAARFQKTLEGLTKQEKRP